MFLTGNPEICQDLPTWDQDDLVLLIVDTSDSDTFKKALKNISFSKIFLAIISLISTYIKIKI